MNIERSVFRGLTRLTCYFIMLLTTARLNQTEKPTALLKIKTLAIGLKQIDWSRARER